MLLLCGLASGAEWQGELIVSDLHGIGPEYILVGADGGMFYKLNMSGVAVDELDIVTLKDVVVDGVLDHKGMIQVASLTPLTSKPGNRAGPPVVQSITFVVSSICDKRGSLGVADLERRYWDGAGSGGRVPTKTTATMEGFYRSCSMGKTLFDKENNIVVGGIDIPCTGIAKGLTFNATKCGSNELYGWANYCEAVAVERGINLSKYKHRIIILPPGVICAWAGLGSVNCGTYCYIWALGSKSMPLSVLWHELGHNMGLMHSSTPWAEYGDTSCIMGTSDLNCFNAVQSWRLKWQDAIDTLDMKNMKVGEELVYNLPLVGTYNSFVRIRYNDLTSYFVSYRSRSWVAYEAGLLNKWDGRVMIHLTNGSITAAIKSELVLGNPVEVGNKIVFGDGQLQVHVKSRGVVGITRLGNVPPVPLSSPQVPLSSPPVPLSSPPVPLSSPPVPLSSPQDYWIMVNTPTSKLDVTQAKNERCGMLRDAMTQLFVNMVGLQKDKDFVVYNNECRVNVFKNMIYIKAFFWVRSKDVYDKIRISKLFQKTGIDELTRVSNTECGSLFELSGFPQSLKYKASATTCNKGQGQGQSKGIDNILGNTTVVPLPPCCNCKCICVY